MNTKKRTALPAQQSSQPPHKTINVISKAYLTATLIALSGAALNSQAQNCYTDTIAETTPNTQFVIHGDGTITDTTTALMWKQCVEGLSGPDCNSGIVELHTWSGALQTANNTNNNGGFAGYADWRVPNVAELVSLVEEQCTDPSINETIFPNTDNKFIWTSSPDFNNDSGTWSVDFNVGTTATLQRDFSYRVLLVRSVQ
jgi:Protein of unknown function (DUF1566)